MSKSWRAAAMATFALLALQWAWVFQARGEADLRPSWVIPTISSLPLLLPALLFLLRRPRAPLWAGIVALLYFCLGIAQLRVAPSAWAAAEVALSLVMVFAAGWPGIAAKLAKRRGSAPPNV